MATENDKKNPENSTKFAEQKKSKGGLKRVWNAFCYSCAGFKAAFKSEHAIRQEILVFVPAAIIAICLPISLYEKIALLAALVLILGFELLNSAIEAVVDDISLEYRELAKHAKDFGSAAVFCSMVIAILVWAAVIFQNFILPILQTKN